MKSRLKLLPHWCQVVGYTYLTIFIISIGIALLLSIIPSAADSLPMRMVISIQDFLLSHWSAVGVMNFIMIFLAIFSREKVEDEMTVSLRLRALVYIVFFLFAIHLLLYLPGDTAAWRCVNGIRNFFMGDFGILAITYALLYKFLIWLNYLRLLYEE